MHSPVPPQEQVNQLAQVKLEPELNEPEVKVEPGLPEAEEPGGLRRGRRAATAERPPYDEKDDPARPAPISKRELSDPGASSRDNKTTTPRNMAFLLSQLFRRSRESLTGLRSQYHDETWVRRVNPQRWLDRAGVTGYFPTAKENEQSNAKHDVLLVKLEADEERQAHKRKFKEGEEEEEEEEDRKLKIRRLG